MDTWTWYAVGVGAVVAFVIFGIGFGVGYRARGRHWR